MSVSPFNPITIEVGITSYKRTYCSKCGSIQPHWLICIRRNGAEQQSKHMNVVCPTCLKKAVRKQVIRISKEEVTIDDLLHPTRKKINRQGRNKKARKREEAIAREIGGHRVSGSGNQIEPGDAANERWMIEDKHTSKVTFNVNRRLLEKTQDQAAKSGRRGAIRIGLNDGTEVAVLAWKDFVNEIYENDS